MSLEEEDEEKIWMKRNGRKGRRDRHKKRTKVGRATIERDIDGLGGEVERKNGRKEKTEKEGSSMR